MTGDRVCVLDVETRMSVEACALLPRGERPKAMRDALVEISAASVLEFTMGEAVGGFSLSTFSSEEVGEVALLRRIDASLARVTANGWLVTHNGTAWDVPVCARRALHHWMHDADGIRSWWRQPGERHVDTMTAFGCGPGRGPSLVDLAAGLGFSAVPSPSSVLRPVSAIVAKGQVDVVATAVCFLHLMAFERHSAGWLAEAWGGLAQYLMTPGVRAPHLMSIASVGTGLTGNQRPCFRS